VNNEDKIRQAVSEDINLRALRIAEAANACCHRSDGYEEAIYKLARKEIGEAILEDRAGGLDHPNNRVLACEPCNKGRGNSMPELKQ